MTIKEIQEALEEGDSLRTIAQAYSEIANLKIKRIRSQVERNRLFFQEIFKVYALIKNLAIKRKVVVPKSKKTISIIITSNYHFYGSINSDLLEFFLNTAQKLNTDVILIGKAADDYFKNNIPSNYHLMLLKTDQPDASELTNLANIIKDYNQVLIFHSRLKSLLVQEPMVSDITTSSSSDEKILNAKGEVDEFKFIFEPELSKIMAFFDSQILTLLLESTFLESELARTASRFISMDQAENEANKFIDEYEKLEAFVKRNASNNEVLENFATMMAARKGDTI